MDTPVIVTVDLDAPGRHFGLLRVPQSTNEGGWSSLDVPIASLVNGSGRTSLVMGGNHGDEPEGMIACYDLLQRVHLGDVCGRLIVIPCLSPDAARNNTRLWPSNNANLNRSFPGSPAGEPNEQLADYLSRYLIPLSDTVIDMHSGGRSGVCLPWSEMHPVDDAEQRQRMVDAMLAWNTDWHFIYIDIAGSGLLAGEAERQGKTHVSTELGGGGTIRRENLDIARGGLTNVLRHVGSLRGAVTSRSTLGKPPATILRATDIEDYLRAPESGFFEPLVTVGGRGEPGSERGRLHFLERPDREAEPIVARTSGIVCSHRAMFKTEAGGLRDGRRSTGDSRGSDGEMRTEPAVRSTGPARATSVIPGGVNSGQRRVTGLEDLVVIATEGATFTDSSGTRYTDYHAAFGPPLLGHNDPDIDAAVLQVARRLDNMGVGVTPVEVELAEKLVAVVPSIEKVLLTVTGSEATFHAVRLARVATGRRLVMKFQGCYHGWHDSVAMNVISSADKIGSKIPFRRGYYRKCSTRP